MDKEQLKSRFPLLFRGVQLLRRQGIRWLGELQRRLLPRRLRQEFRASADPEIREILGFTDARRVEMFPYAYFHEQVGQRVDVRRHSTGHPYVMYEGRPVYFPKAFPPDEVALNFNIALAEQDPRSPHAYLDPGFQVGEGDAGAFVGASNGMFCLSLIGKLRRATLFEPDPAWHEPVRLTFAPWLDKIRLVPQFVRERSGGDGVALDDVFADANDLQFLQADVEGGEMALLQGGSRLWREAARMRIAICTYHRPDDERALTTFLQQYSFTTRPSRGYVIMWMQVPCPRPYLRRAVLYAEKRASS